MKVLMLMIVLTTTLMTGCSPSCEERGGKLERDGTYIYMQYIPTGKSFILIPQQRPKYKCVGAVE